MSSKSETGHYVNNANFKKVVKYCEAKGTSYTPANTKISLANLQTKVTNSENALSDFSKKGAVWGKAVNEREAAYEPVNKLMTRVRNAAKTSENVTEGFIKDVHGLVNVILGVRATPKMKTTPEDPNVPTDDSIVQISAAQTGYNHKYGNIETLVNTLTAEPNYSPNEADLKATALAALLTDLNSKNEAVIEKAPIMMLARDKRDKELYDVNEGTNKLAALVKDYFKAAYGSNSPEYHHLGKLKFVNMKA